MKKIIINGKVLLGSISGIERTSWEFLKAWDRILSKYENVNIDILIPKNNKKISFDFNNIKIVEFGNTNNLTIWQQFYLPKYIYQEGGIYVGFANSAPFLINKGFVLLHDISCLKNKDFYSKKTRIKFILETKHIIHGNFKIATVSNFSAKEIANEFNINKNEILVLGNGWEHLKNIETDESIFNKYPVLKEKQYYFSLSSLAPNKNIMWIMETARVNPDYIFAIGGDFKKDIYGEVYFNIPSNVIMLGRISDEEAKALFKNTKAFLFPTFYEGFGIPPLEAYAYGTVSIVSDSEVMHEVYGDAVTYIDTNNPCKGIDKIRLPVYEKEADILKKHSWHRYAKMYLDYIVRNISEINNEE